MEHILESDLNQFSHGINAELKAFKWEILFWFLLMLVVQTIFYVVLLGDENQNDCYKTLSQCQCMADQNHQ